jgi:two-component system OmpR family response regulator
MRILVVEDDQDLNRQICRALESNGFVADHALDGEEGQFLGETEPYDAIILDMGLPVINGLTVLKAWREQAIKTPVLVLTARDSWSDKVEAIDTGADDYVTKPFHMEEILARLRALIRRASGHASNLLTHGPVSLNLSSQTVQMDGQEINLTAHEYRLLAYLMSHQGRVISKTELTEHLYDQDFDKDSNTIEVFVGRVRRKLGLDLIRTIRGQGYQVPSPSADDPA